MQSSADPVVTIRVSMADESGGEAIRRLAALHGAPPPEGLVAIAHLDGEPVAALGFADGDAVADPDRSSPAIIALLHLHRLALRMVVAVWGV